MDDPQTSSPARWRKPLVRALKALVAVVVFWGVGRHVWRTWNDLGGWDAALRVRPWFLVLSGLLYLAGLAFCGLFYHAVLRASPSPIGQFAAVRAYLISHLGKYVPGKAMVVVMRAGMSVPHGARGATATVATFYETLVMMASGSLVAAAGFALASDPPIELGADPPIPTFILPGLGMVSLRVFALLALASLGMGVGFLVVVAPPVFRRLVKTASLPIRRVGLDASPRFSARLLGLGLIETAAAWLMMGMSQMAVVWGVATFGGLDFLALLPIVVAAVAFATVAGFVVAVAPGGLGVREGVLMYALGPALGNDVAVVAALTLRLVWVAAEITAALVLGPFGSRRERKPE